MSVTRRLKSADIAAAFRATGGMVYTSARQLGVSPVSIYRRLEREPKLKELLESIRAESVDIAEIALSRAVVNGESWAVVYKLKCHGKDRGYVERQEVEISGRGGGPLEVRAYRYDDAVARIAARPDSDGAAPGADEGDLRGPEIREDHDGG